MKPENILDDPYAVDDENAPATCPLCAKRDPRFNDSNREDSTRRKIWAESFEKGQRVEVLHLGGQWVPGTVVGHTRSGYPGVDLDNGGYTVPRKGRIRPLREEP